MFSGLRSHILLITLLPSCLISLVLGLYLNHARSTDLSEFISERGQATTRQFAYTARLALIEQQPEILQLWANSALEEKGLRSVSIVNKQGQYLVHAGPQTIFQPPYPNMLEQFIKNDVSSFVMPLTLHPLISEVLNTATTAPTALPQANQQLWAVVEYNNDNYTLKRFEAFFIQNSLLFIFFILAAIIALRLSQNLSKDILKVNDGLKQLAKGNNTIKQEKMLTVDMQDLADNLSSASSAINREFEDMRHNVELTTSDLKQTIETIEVQNIELSIAKKTATESSQIKSEFLANTSHEIRTPLNGVLGFTKLLKRTPLSQQQQDYVETIHQSSEGLLAIINDILDFSKIEAGKLSLDSTPFNIRQAFEDITALFGPQAYDKGIEIALMIYQDVPNQLIGDPLRIKQIISNLLSNAVKFTPSGTIAIRVSLESETETEAQISVSMSDSGIGMTNEQLNILFETFTQANNSISRQYGGTGLGLSIVKNLIRQMHGEIHADSQPNEGTTFSFNMMLKKSDRDIAPVEHHWQDKKVGYFEPHALVNLSTQHLLEDFGCKVYSNTQLDSLQENIAEEELDVCIYSVEARSDADKDISSLQQLMASTDLPILVISSHNLKLEAFCQKNENIHFCSKPISEQRLHKSLLQAFNQQSSYVEAAVSNPKPLINLHILIADDQPANLKLLNILLGDLGAKVMTAINGEEAIQQAEAFRFDIIFMDIQMPIIDGIKATETIKASSSSNQDTPIIALTANVLEKEKKQLLKTHFSQYLTKPISEEELIHTIEEHCQTIQKSLDIINPQLSLKLANNKKDLAIDMFDMFISDIKNAIGSLSKLQQEKNYPELVNIVHKLHGACCYTGAPTLKHSCKSLEDIINSDKADHLADKQLTKLLIDANNILRWQENNNLAQLLESL